MLSIGMTGGMGSGKSAVSKELGKQPDTAVYTMDDAAKRIRDSKEFLPVALDMFGRDILADGRIDNRRMAARFFADPQLQKRYEATIGPLVVNDMLDEMARARRAGKEKFVAESAILFEKGLDRWFDVTVCVTCLDYVRRDRLRRFRDFTDAEIDARLKLQMPQEEKARLADIRFDNSVTLHVMRTEAAMLWNDLRGWPRTSWHSKTEDMLKWRHGGPNRHLHDWKHVTSRIHRMYDLVDLAPEPVYNAVQFFQACLDDPEASAELARLWLPDRYVPDETARLVMLRPEEMPDEGDLSGRMFCDVVLSDLGCCLEEFTAMAARRRQELPKLSDDDFWFAYASPLKQLIERPHVFHSEKFRARYEQNARINIRTALDRAGL